MTFKFQAVMALVEQISPELITLNDEEYAISSASVSAILWKKAVKIEIGVRVQFQENRSRDLDIREHNNTVTRIYRCHSA